MNDDELRGRLRGLDAKLDRILRVQQLQLSVEVTMSAELDALTAAVARDTEVEKSAITLLQGLKASLDAAGTDPAKLKELSDHLSANADALAAAIVANTPAAPPPAQP